MHVGDAFEEENRCEMHNKLIRTRPNFPFRLGWTDWYRQQEPTLVAANIESIQLQVGRDRVDRGAK